MARHTAQGFTAVSLQIHAQPVQNWEHIRITPVLQMEKQPVDILLFCGNSDSRMDQKRKQGQVWTAQGAIKQCFRVMGQICAGFDQQPHHVHPVFQHRQFQRRGFLLPRPCSNRYLIALRLIGRMPRMKQGTECLNVAASDGSHHGRYIGIAYFTHRNPPDSLFKNFLIPLSQLLRCRLDSLAAAVLCSLPPNAPEHILPDKVLGSFVLAIFFRQVVL